VVKTSKTHPAFLYILDLYAKFHQNWTKISKVRILVGFGWGGWVGWWVVKPSQPLKSLDFSSAIHS